jgi:hypothetical protein
VSATRDRGGEPLDSGELKLIGDGFSGEMKGTNLFLSTSRID